MAQQFVQPSTFEEPVLDTIGPNIVPQFQYGRTKIPDTIVKSAAIAKDLHPNVFWAPIHGAHTYFGHGVTLHTLLRPLTRNEYELYNRLLENNIEFNQSVILDNCILVPEDKGVFDILPAGHLESCYNIILDLSGWFKDEDMGDLQNYARSHSNNYILSVIDTVVSTVFKGITPQAMRKMDAHETLELLAMAENITGSPVNLISEDIEGKQKEELAEIIKNVNTK